jgi:hypothetical protein
MPAVPSFAEQLCARAAAQTAKQNAQRDAERSALPRSAVAPVSRASAARAPELRAPSARVPAAAAAVAACAAAAVAAAEFVAPVSMLRTSTGAADAADLAMARLPAGGPTSDVERGLRRAIQSMSDAAPGHPESSDLRVVKALLAQHVAEASRRSMPPPPGRPRTGAIGGWSVDVIWVCFVLVAVGASVLANVPARQCLLPDP